MPLILSSETQMVRDTAQEFFRERAPITALRKLRDANDPDGFSRSLWREMAELGWTGFLVPEDFGGTDFGVLGLAQVMEAAGRTLAASALVSTALVGASLLAVAGSAAQKSDHLPPLVSGERLYALALEEGSRHQPYRIATQADRAGEGYRLSGQKVFVLDGHVADVLIVAARTSGGREEREGVTLFLVPGDLPGVTRQRTIMIDSRNAAQVRLDNVTVGPDAVLGRVGGGADVLDRVLDRARACLAAEMLGSATEAFERTVQYLKDRKQFGVAIGSFQALKHRAAQMFCEVELTRSAVVAACSALDENANDASALAALAKGKANDTLDLCGNEGVQMHGGIGMTDEHEIGFFMKRARVARATFGDTAFCRDRYATLLGNLMMRLLIAKVSHETNTFSPVPTPVARFCPDGETLLTGQAAIDFYRGTTSCIGRYLAIADELSAEVVLPVAAAAPPSGPVDDDAFDLFCSLITDALQQQRFDAIMLDLHGAMVTRQYEDAEGELLRRVRAVAPDTKLSVSLDMHANIFDGIVSRADVIAGYRTYPHVDHLPTAERAGRTLVRTLRGEVHPVTAWANAPMLPHVMAQGSYRSPNKDLQAMADAMEQNGEALVASVFTGFPHADVSQAGLSAVVVTDGDAAAAQRLVTRLLDAAWEARQSFTFQTEPLAESVARAKVLDGPVVMLDHCDNSSSGGTMDTTTVLAEIMRQGLEYVVFFGIYDPDAVQAAMHAGVGATVELRLGGRMQMPSIPGNNEPLLVRGRVRTLSAGYFVSESPMRAGVAVTMGPMAVLDTGKVEIVLISRHAEPSDLGLFKVVGIDPAKKHYVAIKSRVHWRADLGSLAKHVVECNGLGVCTSDYGILKFDHVRRPIYPLDLINERA